MKTASDAQSLSVLINAAQSGLSSIGLVFSAISVQSSTENSSSLELKSQADKILHAANNIALSLLTKKVPGIFNEIENVTVHYLISNIYQTAVINIEL